MSAPTVLLEERAGELIAAEAGRRRWRETGGALFGFCEGDDLVVACAYGPGPRARHRRASFEPHPETTQLLMDAVREHSSARYRYLGSWHSHPGGAATPSGPDVASTATVAGEAEVLLPRPLMMIQATRPQQGQAAELCAWRWEPTEERVICTPIETIRLEQRLCPLVPVPAGWHRHPQELSPDP